MNQSYPQDIFPLATAAGASVSRTPIIYFGISVKRLVCLFILTMGLYRYYWSYKNWQAIKRAEQSDISPFWRSFFGIFFCYELFKYMAESVENYSNKKPFSPRGFAWGYIIFHIIGLWILKIFLLIKAQRAILFNNTQIIPNYTPVKQFTRVEIIWIIIGIIFWTVGIRKVFMGDKPKTYVTTWINT